MHFKGKGFSLVELLVGLLLSSIFLLAVTRIFSESASSYRSNRDELTLMETSRFALQDITKDLKRAGYLGCVPTGLYEDEDDNSERVIVNLRGPGNASLYGSGGMQFSYAVYGVDGSGDKPDVLNVVYSQDLDIRVLDFKGQHDLADAYGKDIIVDATNVLDSAGAPVIHEGDLLVLSDCATAHPFVLTANPAVVSLSTTSAYKESGITKVAALENSTSTVDGFQNIQKPSMFNDYASGGASSLGKLFHITYMVGKSKIDPDGDKNSLFRIVNGEAPSIHNELISAVKDFQIKYGVRDDAANAQDGLPDRFIDANGNFDNTPSAVTIKITLDRGSDEEMLETTINLRNRGL
ncbi:PilW family protein [Litoribrevibacter albus]|uniref:Prepilin-type N-terminal cleavage/methylation domain-containing protein n=1 Tax=Litoribrevibacter albus TaxID=1473156 RepID=A0AA37W487_9GAMM|nr:prepilin-type N-terminal cleavage/methylation domain-containing protein [Litoribrevibacter albus]GLQ29907.1 hypothetical protein GCM10007876_03850 [Litoribrevibacter albus]